MRWIVAISLCLIICPSVEAGTRDDPELRDPENDVQRWPGIPTADPSSDFIAVWFHEDEQNLYLSMEVVEHVTHDPEIPNVVNTADHLIGAHVNGEGEQTPCSGWGAFTVRDVYRSQSGWEATLRIYWPMEQQTSGCGGDDLDIPVQMEDNVATFTVPWSLLSGHIAAGDELTVSDARAGSASTWPATPSDYADHAPGRPYVVQYGAPAQVANETASPGDDSMDPVPGDDKDSSGNSNSRDTADNQASPDQSSKKTPSSLLVTLGVLAAMVVFSRRR